MTIYRIRQPTEYSFLQWINNYPDSGHWKDRERFLIFVKTVCKYNATKWKDSNYLKNRILEAKPHFNREFLDRLLDLYEKLIQFYKIGACPNLRSINNRRVKKNHYIEVRVKKGNIYERELPWEEY
jgi:hypothetical protein